MRSVRVIERNFETAAIVALTLAGPDRDPMPAYDAGAHIDLEVKPGLLRQYSLYSRDDGSGLYRIGILKDPQSRGGSVAAHELVPGDTVRISDPRNSFPLAAGTHRSILLAGGIGVTPLLAMAETLHHEGRPFELHYCARSRGQAAFLTRLRDRGLTPFVSLHFDDEPSSQRLDIGELFGSLDRSEHLYVCGPPGFIDWISQAATTASWPDAQFHREYFQAVAPSVESGDRAFTAIIASTGQRISVPANQTLVAALNTHGFNIPVSCEAGVCGTCLIGVRDGTPDCRDYYLTAAEKAEGRVILPCCSRAKTESLVLEL